MAKSAYTMVIRKCHCSGMSLIAENDTPTDEQITEHMAGNICRCGCYQRIQAAVKSAALEQASKGA